MVELMVAASILSVGIALVLRSFLITISALGTAEDRIAAMQLLEQRMSALEIEDKEESGIKTREEEEQVILRNRSATLKTEITHTEIEGVQQNLNEVRLSLIWQEGRVSRDAVLVTYMQDEE